MSTDHPTLGIVTCPNNHNVPVPTRSIEDLTQDCPVCGPFRRRPGNTGVITLDSPRPIDWCVTELTAALHRHVPSEDDRTAMAESGALRSLLERFRGEYEARGVNYDAVMAAVIEAEELVPSHTLPEQ